MSAEESHHGIEIEATKMLTFETHLGTRTVLSSGCTLHHIQRVYTYIFSAVKYSPDIGGAILQSVCLHTLATPVLQILALPSTLENSRASCFSSVIYGRDGYCVPSAATLHR